MSLSEGQEPTGYVALSLVDLHFIPETSPNKVLPSLCRAARRSPGVDANQTVEGGKGGAGGELNEKQHPPKIHTKCREGWDSFEGKCYKVCKVDCLALNFPICLGCVKFGIFICCVSFLHSCICKLL